MIGDCIVDASVGIKLFVNEELSDVADRLFDQLAATPPSRFYVPDLFYVECANILWKYVRRFNYPPQSAKQDIADLQALALISVSTADILQAALELALIYEITAYDASYAALAQALDLPLVTADITLINKLKGSGITVESLSALKDIR